MKKFNFNTFLMGCLALCLLPATNFAQNSSIERLKVLGAERALEKNSDSKLVMGLESLYSPEGIEKLDGQIISRRGKILISAIPSGSPAKLKSDLEAMGATNVQVAMKAVQAWVSADQLAQLENIPSLVCAMPEYTPTKKVGATTSQGDQAMRSDLIRKFQGVDGSGITIGILSDAYNSLGGADAGVASGDLPGPGNPNGFTQPVDVLSEIIDGPGIDEGRGMAELVHDVAPGAKLKFWSAFNGFYDFADGILALADAGCDIIVDDIGYFASPNFQDGFIAQSVTTVTQAGVAYFSSAGNGNRESYEAPFQSSGIGIPGIGLLHDFGGGDVFQRITIPPGGSINYWLQWDDHSVLFSDFAGPAPAADIDIYLFDPATGSFVAQSIFDNAGLGAPIEILSYSNPTASPQELDIIIASFSGPIDRRLKYIDYGDGILPDEYNTFSGTCIGHSQADGGFGVGASAYFNTNEFGLPTSDINGFSSAGGVPIILDTQGNRLPAPIVREQPYLTGPDGANTTFFPPGGFDFEGDGFPNFFGTSAAAPHVAAVAALLKEKDPSLSPEEIGLALRNTAEDMDDELTNGFDVGFDFNTGYGMVQADAALASIADEACVYRFQVFETKTGDLIGTLRDGDVIDLAAVKEGLINIVALVDGGPDKATPAVRFDLTGKINRDEIDYEAPYALFGDRNGKLNDWYVHVGDYKLQARILGAKKKAVEISFSVINSAKVEAFLLVNAKNDQIIGELGDEIDLNTLPTDRFNIVAQMSDDSGNSRGVRFQLSGTQTRYSIDNKAPYALFKDNNGDFFHWPNPEPGTYTLKGTALGNWNSNSAGEIFEKKFTILKGTPSKTDRRVTTKESPNSNFVFHVYPNPSADFVAFDYSIAEKEPITLEIFTMGGQRIFKTKKRRNLAVDVDFRRFGPGMYLAKLTANGEVISQQIAIH